MPIKNYHALLFCSHPFEPNKPDPDFEEEYLAAQQTGFSVLLFSYEELTSNNIQAALTQIPPLDSFKFLIYRGWMLTPVQYGLLYNVLYERKYKLINTPKEYQNCHYLPDSLRFIKNHTPLTIYQKIENPQNIDAIIDEAKVFFSKPVIIKDYVKSEKHDWDTACFVSDASNLAKLRNTIENFLELRGEYLNEGIVIREYLDLNNLAPHSKSGMPLSEEYRLFFFNNRLLDIYDYWEEPLYNVERPGIKKYLDIALLVESNFFTMDIARQKNGKSVIIELGDGQVSGLPAKADKVLFYKKLDNLMDDLTIPNVTNMKVQFIGETHSGRKFPEIYMDLTNGQIYDVLSIKRGWYLVIDDSEEQTLYWPELFKIVSA